MLKPNHKSKLTALVVLSLILSFASYQLVTSYVAEKASQEVAEQREIELGILVSQRDILVGEIINSDILVVRNFPQSLVQDNWLRPEDAPSIIGLASSRFIDRGEPLTANAIEPYKTPRFSSNLKPGFYGVTSLVSVQQLHNGLVKIGDHVTLRGSDFQDSSEPLVLVNIPVIAMDNFDNEAQLDINPSHYLPSTMTFEFTPMQAEIFEVMKLQNFGVWLQRPGSQYVVSTPPVPVKIHRFFAKEVSTDAIY
jgi:Flp pilus assembly protein CpaB